MKRKNLPKAGYSANHSVAAKHKSVRKRTGRCAVVALSLLAGCAQAAESPALLPVTSPSPQLKAELIGTPVRSSRAWTSAVAPSPEGGWNFVTQLYEYPSSNPTEYVVVNLETGKQKLFETPAGRLANSNYQYQGQLRAPNGRIFFGEMGNISYYEPKDESIHSLGTVIDPKGGDKFLYRLVFGPDGMLYGATQTDSSQTQTLPTVVRINPETLEHKVLGEAGTPGTRLTYSYGYYLAVDPTPSPGAPQGWAYVAVGQNPWELYALNIATGQGNSLATRSGEGWITVEPHADGVVAKLIMHPYGKEKREEVKVWCADGQSFPFEEKYDPGQLPFKPRNVTPVTSAVDFPYELDLTRLNAETGGEDKAATGQVFWRKKGSKDAWKETTFQVKHTAPVAIESLLTLPDGTLLGNAKQYHGFFRYDPQTKKTAFYGAHGPSRGPRVVMDGLAYIAGYPNSVLYAFDPQQPWTSPRDRTPGKNPAFLGDFFAFTDTKYASRFAVSKNGRIYLTGHRERSGTGGGIGYYEPATKTFGGHHEKLNFLDPDGLLVLDDMKRVVLSGGVNNDPASLEQAPKDAQLVVYDWDLKEIERVIVKQGLKNTGVLFAAGKDQLIGVSGEDNLLYLYDLRQHKLLKELPLAGAVSAMTRRESDGSIWLTIDKTLWRIHPADWQMKAVGQLDVAPTILQWLGDDLYFTGGGSGYAAGTELYCVRW
jgi:catechol 2,3-dioxygenase-like lactoylglutathione lyase family enzyme